VDFNEPAAEGDLIAPARAGQQQLGPGDQLPRPALQKPGQVLLGLAGEGRRDPRRRGDSRTSQVRLAVGDTVGERGRWQAAEPIDGVEGRSEMDRPRGQQRAVERASRRFGVDMDAMSRMALPPSEEPRSRTVTGSSRAGKTTSATAVSTQSWSARIADCCAVECRS
jgi:hypothetical protein